MRGEEEKMRAEDEAEKMIKETIGEIEQEVADTMRRFPGGFDGSHHRAYGVLAEEFFELQVEIFKKPRERDRDRIRWEAKQIASVAIQIMHEFGGGK